MSSGSGMTGGGLVAYDHNKFCVCREHCRRHQIAQIAAMRHTSIAMSHDGQIFFWGRSVLPNVIQDSVNMAAPQTQTAAAAAAVGSPVSRNPLLGLRQHRHLWTPTHLSLPSVSVPPSQKLILAAFTDAEHSGADSFGTDMMVRFDLAGKEQQQTDKSGTSVAAGAAAGSSSAASTTAVDSGKLVLRAKEIVSAYRHVYVISQEGDLFLFGEPIGVDIDAFVKLSADDQQQLQPQQQQQSTGSSGNSPFFGCRLRLKADLAVRGVFPGHDGSTALVIRHRSKK